MNAAVAEWGPWRDPHTEAGVARYGEMGLDLATPADTRGLDPDALQRVAEDCGALLTEAYKGTYPIDNVRDADLLVNSVLEGVTDLYTLSNGSGLLAMAALVRHRNAYGGPVRMAELGRACALPQTSEAKIPLGPFLKLRVPHTLEQDPTGLDFFVSSTRAAETSYQTPLGEVPSGRGVQGVWWGSRNFDGSSALLTTYANWKYRLGGVEPFNSFTIPADPEKWGAAVAATPLYVSSEFERYVIGTLITEGSNGKVQPDIRVASTEGDAPPLSLGLISPHSRSATSRYAVTKAIETPLHLGDVDTALDDKDAFTQEVIIEADVSTTPAGAQAMRQLREGGFTLVGWEPSNITYGALCPVYSRISPAVVGDLIAAGHHREYFDDSGLTQTRNILGLGFAAMVAQASKAST